MQALNILLTILLSAILILPYSVKGQILSLGYKHDKKGMFQASFNYPFVLDKSRPYEYMLGVDYTTNNSSVPSGLQPQATFLYHILDNYKKDYLLSGGVSAGYLLDFNKQFNNQFRVSPHFYFEYLCLFNVRIGADYIVPLNKVYPYISLGIGGFHMLRYIRIM